MRGSVVKYSKNDFFKCKYCRFYYKNKHYRNGQMITADHFIPRSKGGHNSKDNIVAACKDCNTIKADIVFKNFKEARRHIMELRKEKGLPIPIYIIKTFMKEKFEKALGKKVSIYGDGNPVLNVWVHDKLGEVVDLDGTPLETGHWINEDVKSLILNMD